MSDERDDGDSGSLAPVKGVRDVYPEDMRVRRWLFGHWREVAESFGYEEYDACVLEHEALYTRKAGDEITGQLFNFQDKGGRRVALRPELTPSLARMVMARGAALPLPARWFAIPQCFRYEQVQRGRKREHYQWNMDVVGLASVAAEAELMAAQVAFLRRTGLTLDGPAPDIVLKVSHRQVLGGVLAGMGIAGERFASVCVVIDKRGKISDEALAGMLGELGVSAGDAARILDLIATDGLEAIASKIPADNPGLIELRRLLHLAEGLGIAHLIRLDLSVIRGLSYYTGTVWEVFAQRGTLYRAVAGGGRYDRLCEMLGGTPMPMVGFGFGDVVIIEVLKELSLLPPLPRRVDAVVYPMSEAEHDLANRIAARQRAGGARILVDYSGRRFKHAIQRAEAEGATRFIVIGGNEAKAGVALVRTLGGSERHEQQVPLGELL